MFAQIYPWNLQCSTYFHAFFSPFHELQQFRCQVSDQSLLSRSYVCCHVLQQSTVSSILYRPGSSFLLQWCLHQFSVRFLIHTNMMASTNGWKLRYWMLQFQLLSANIEPQFLFKKFIARWFVDHAEQNKLFPAIRSSNLPTDNNPVLSLLLWASGMISFVFWWCQSCSSSPTQPECGIWHRWPWHPPGSTSQSFLVRRYSFFVVWLVRDWQDSVDQCKWCIWCSIKMKRSHL